VKKGIKSIRRLQCASGRMSKDLTVFPGAKSCYHHLRMCFSDQLISSISGVIGLNFCKCVFGEGEVTLLTS
jgi:hypothetical protein